MHTYIIFCMKQHDPLIGSDLHEVAHMLRLEIDKRVRGFDLTRVKWLALETIEIRPRLTQTELADELGLGTATIGRLIDRLEKRQLVQRLPDERDRRSYRLVLTSKATKLLKDLEDVASSLRGDLLEGLSSTEIRSLKTGLSKLRSNLVCKMASIFVPVWWLQADWTLEVDLLTFGILVV